jgi:hypothetical protein
LDSDNGVVGEGLHQSICRSANGRGVVRDSIMAPTGCPSRIKGTAKATRKPVSCCQAAGAHDPSATSMLLHSKVRFRRQQNLQVA